ncbi:MogA/MoaB family molybdenum cofactor biosynthesis protein [Metabacillus fastidiosus]|uniref:MogA/MoaB family molybdenum cofactor biosynthesis protein n=1 Tax=Metabacillus fastidiosus TaxID=1458 RepID=UPI0008248112|nr:MogA/MoaB family molybdenum cofactor biosynthesis protein [Metabacillus fastidiosus]MED4464131.1 MogA/MoaB family molybdenum cofactor biosynthesis protein [Metabacillus fastidiosus]
MSNLQHKKEAPSIIKCKIITVSDTRTAVTDKSGQLMKNLLEDYNYIAADYGIVKDEKTAIHDAVLDGLRSNDIDIILINGGTGIAKRDVTIEVVKDFIEKEISGFGELFRMLSYTEDIGSAAILSRAIAGVTYTYNKAIFSVPGSSGAVKLAMEKLIIPELGHVMREIKKDL